ncbi:hypothetical protein [Nonomuraea dietziae]|uniref:hypothetical protein n=1 Tax=Nonomuraea dietziae TaxID=65515 RepID=UPI0031DFDF61
MGHGPSPRSPKPSARAGIALTLAGFERDFLDAGAALGRRRTRRTRRGGTGGLVAGRSSLGARRPAPAPAAGEAERGLWGDDLVFDRPTCSACAPKRMPGGSTAGSWTFGDPSPWNRTDDIWTRRH